MAIFAHDALGETSVGFAWAYAAFQPSQIPISATKCWLRRRYTMPRRN